MIARLGTHLLTGGGYGVMLAAAEGFTAVEPRAGLSIGIIPRDRERGFETVNHDPEGRPYPNRFVEVAIRTPLASRADDWRHVPARNHINVLTADAIIALPGQAGTHNELDMAAYFGGEMGRRREQRRTILLGPAGEFTSEHRSLFMHAADVAAAERHVRHILELAVPNEVP
jgi:predicted Rossmann-fold nucleotide-binding protein